MASDREMSEEPPSSYDETDALSGLAEDEG